MPFATHTVLFSELMLINYIIVTLYILVDYNMLPLRASPQVVQYMLLWWFSNWEGGVALIRAYSKISNGGGDLNFLASVDLGVDGKTSKAMHLFLYIP